MRRVALLLLLTLPAAAFRDAASERLFARARQNVRAGDYWSALRDLEILAGTEPNWPEAARLRRTAGYQAHYRSALSLMESGNWTQAREQLENARAYSATPALARAMRDVESHLAARDQDAKFRATFASAQDALNRSDLAAARALLQDCSRLKPADEGVRSALSRLDGREKLAAWLSATVRSLSAADWQALDANLKHIPDGDDSFALLPSFRLFAQGRTAEARATAKRLAIADDPSREEARAFLLFLNARERARRFPGALGTIGGLYIAALLASLYAGLRRETLRHHPA